MEENICKNMVSNSWVRSNKPGGFFFRKESAGMPVYYSSLLNKCVHTLIYTEENSHQHGLIWHLHLFSRLDHVTLLAGLAVS